MLPSVKRQSDYLLDSMREQAYSNDLEQRITVSTTGWLKSALGESDLSRIRGLLRRATQASVNTQEQSFHMYAFPRVNPNFKN